MQVSVETTGGLQRRMTINIPAEKIDSEVEKRLRTLAPKVKLSGFRPGRVPLSVVKKRYSSQVKAEVFGDLASSSFYEAVNQENLKPATIPKFSSPKSEANSDYQFTADFEVYPEVLVNGIESIEINRPKVEINDSDIDAMLENLRKQHGSWEEVERASENDDQIHIDFSGKLNGEIFEGGSGKMPLVLGSNSMIDGFEQGLLGAKPGEKRELDLTFPEKYHKEDLAGKNVQFSVLVEKVEAPRLPDIDAEFAKSFGIASGDIQDFRMDLQKNMQRELKRAIRTKVKHQVTEALLEKHDIEVPKSMVQAESQRLAEQMSERMKARDGMTAASISPDAFESQGKRRVILGLVLSEIISSNDLQADPSKVREEVETLASSYDDPAQVIAWYYQKQNQKNLKDIESVVLEEAAIEWVLERAQVTEELTTFDELMNNPTS